MKWKLVYKGGYIQVGSREWYRSLIHNGHSRGKAHGTCNGNYNEGFRVMIMSE